MVKIESEQNGCCATNGASSGPEQEVVVDSKADTKLRAEAEMRARETEIDLSLVEEIRGSLRSEWEQTGDKFAPLHYEEIMNPHSPLTCWRYINHCGRKLTEALELMKASLSWRQENCIDALDRSELIKEFWHFTPIPLGGQTREGHEILYVIGRHYRKPSAKLKPFIPKFCGNVLFTWDREHNFDLKKLHVIFDVSDTGYRNIDLDFMSWLLSIKDYLPDRWHQFSVVGVPFIVRPLIQLVISWVPESYRSLVHLGSFDKLVREAIDDENLPVEVGGKRDETDYKMAPSDAPWASESPIFSSEQMLKYVEECIQMNDTKRAELRQLQLAHDKISTK